MTHETVIKGLKQAEGGQQAAVQSEQPQQTTNNKYPAFLQRERLEPILVIVTAGAIAASLLAERLGAPHWLILALNVVSYIAGGVFWLRAGGKKLPCPEVYLHLLEVLAAICS